MEDSFIQKSMKKAKAHKKKTGALVSIATVISVLQLIGMLGPLVCSLPMVSNQAQCLTATQKAGELAKNLHQLDGMKLDDGTPMEFELVNEDAP